MDAVDGGWIARRGGMWVGALVVGCAAAGALGQGGLEQPVGGALSSAEVEESGAGPSVGRNARRSLERMFEEEGAGLGAEIEGAEEEPGEEDGEESWLHLWAGVDFATAYVSRGFVWEDSGLVVQPWADVWFDVWRGDEATASLTLGTWSSLHSQATGAGTSDALREHWYELDLYVGGAVEWGAWTLEGRYCWYTSPSDAWDTIEEVYLSAALDDSEWLGAWALWPSVLVAIETGEEANDGYDTGTYLEIAIEPGFGLDALGAEGALGGAWVSFPCSVGLSLDDYYESEDDEGEYEDVFGYAAAGVTLSVPLTGEGGVLADVGGEGPGGLGGDSWGGWALTLGVQVVWMGDATASFNEDDEVIVVGMVGVGVEF